MKCYFDINIDTEYEYGYEFLCGIIFIEFGAPIDAFCTIIYEFYIGYCGVSTNYKSKCT